MPSSMTHTYFGMDIYQKLNKNSKDKIKDSIEYYKLFCQGSDPFMFYHFLLGKKAKEMGKIQKMVHTTKTRDFFFSIIKYINDNNLSNNKYAMAYLYGHICHYYLDLYTHPFLYYKSGVFKKDNKNTYKYNGLHQKIEYAIDLYFIKNRENIDSKKFKVYKEIFNVKGLPPDLKNIINDTMGNVYSIDNISAIYENSIWYMKYFFKLANYDPYGVKLKIYKLIDNISPKSFIRVKELSFYNKYKDIDRWLNLNNDIWYLPWDKSKYYKTSFLDLYEISMNEAIKTINEVTLMLDSKKLNKKRLYVLFQDLSYATGLKCGTEVKLKYFEF